MTVQEIFKEYRKEKDNIEISIDRMKTELGSLTEKIVLYGAGSAGIAFLYYLRDIGIYPKYFADGNPEKWGTVCEGIPVIDYHEIKQKLGLMHLLLSRSIRMGKSTVKALMKL